MGVHAVLYIYALALCPGVGRLDLGDSKVCGPSRPDLDFYEESKAIQESGRSGIDGVYEGRRSL